MKKFTHQFVSLGVSFLLFNLLGIPSVPMIIGTFLSIWVGILPDLLDFKLFEGLHRNFLTHSPFSPIIIPLFFIFYIIAELLLPSTLLYPYVLIMLSIWDLHLLLDIINPTGIPIIPGKNISITNIRYDNLKYNLLFSLIGIGLFFISFLIF
ncbi:MAG: metal-dependent hydrolase [Promethearchaeota archaeon]